MIERRLILSPNFIINTLNNDLFNRSSFLQGKPIACVHHHYSLCFTDIAIKPNTLFSRVPIKDFCLNTFSSNRKYVNGTRVKHDAIPVNF